MKSKRAIFIDAKHRTITECENTGLESLQACVEGLIETAHRFPNGDVLFVNEEGLFKAFEYGFGVEGAPAPYFVGNGVVVGATDRNGNDLSAKSKIADLMNTVGFCKLVKTA